MKTTNEWLQKRRKREETLYAKEPLPEFGYFYVSDKRGLNRILKKGIIPSDKYNKGDLPVIWIHKEHSTKRLAMFRIEIRIDPDDLNWLKNWGSDGLLACTRILTENDIIRAVQWRDKYGEKMELWEEKSVYGEPLEDWMKRLESIKKKEQGVRNMTKDGTEDITCSECGAVKNYNHNCPACGNTSIEVDGNGK